MHRADRNLAGPGLQVVVEHRRGQLGTLTPLAAVRALDPDPQPGVSIYKHQRRFAATITAVCGEFRREGILVDYRGCFSGGGLPEGEVVLMLHPWVKDGPSLKRGPEPLPLGMFTLGCAIPLAVELTLPQR